MGHFAPHATIACLNNSTVAQNFCDMGRNAARQREQVDGNCRFVSAKGKKKHQLTNKQIRILSTTVIANIVIFISYFSLTVIGVEITPGVGGCLHTKCDAII